MFSCHFAQTVVFPYELLHAKNSGSAIAHETSKLFRWNVRKLNCAVSFSEKETAENAIFKKTANSRLRTVQWKKHMQISCEITEPEFSE